jgi:hypothetical protein
VPPDVRPGHQGGGWRWGRGRVGWGGLGFRAGAATKAHCMAAPRPPPPLQLIAARDAAPVPPERCGRCPRASTRRGWWSTPWAPPWTWPHTAAASSITWTTGGGGWGWGGGRQRRRCLCACARSADNGVNTPPAPPLLSVSHPPPCRHPHPQARRAGLCDGAGLLESPPVALSGVPAVEAPPGGAAARRGRGLHPVRRALAERGCVRQGGCCGQGGRAAACEGLLVCGAGNPRRVRHPTPLPPTSPPPQRRIPVHPGDDIPRRRAHRLLRGLPQRPQNKGHAHRDEERRARGGGGVRGARQGGRRQGGGAGGGRGARSGARVDGSPAACSAARCLPPCVSQTATSPSFPTAPPSPTPMAPNPPPQGPVSLDSYPKRLETSWIWTELERERNIRPGFRWAPPAARAMRDRSRAGRGPPPPQLAPACSKGSAAARLLRLVPALTPALMPAPLPPLHPAGGASSRASPTRR